MPPAAGEKAREHDVMEQQKKHSPQPAATPSGAAYALPIPGGQEARIYASLPVPALRQDGYGYYNVYQMESFADRTHALRLASNGQAPAGAKSDPPPAQCPTCGGDVWTPQMIEKMKQLADELPHIGVAPAPVAQQLEAGTMPPTDIRKAALDLYTPPFRHEHGFIRDANNEIVADDASSVGTGLIAARIRGWGRIQYMDSPAGRANALQDEMADIVAEALNAHWENATKPKKDQS